MEKKTVIINVQTDDGVKQLDRLSAKFDEVYGDVLPLTGAIGELEDQLYEMAKQGQQGTDEFKALAEEAGRLKKTIAQVDMEVDALSMTTANKLGGALGGAASGFELVQGAMGAMGAESEHIETALLKVQSAMAMAQGVQGIKEAIPAFKSMGSAALKALGSIKGAVMATGIGLLAVAVGLVASNWDKIKESTEKASKSFNDYLNSGTKGSKALKWYLDALVYPITLLIKGYREIKDLITGTSDASRKVAAVQKDIHEKRVKQLEKERDSAKKVGDATVNAIDKEIALRSAAGKSTLDLEKKKQEAIMNTSRLALQGLVEEVKARLALGGVTKEEADKLKQLINDNKKAYADAAQSIKVIEIQAQTERTNKAKEASAERIQNEQEEVDKLKEIWETKIQNDQALLDAGKSFSDIAKERREQDLADIKATEQGKYDYFDQLRKQNEQKQIEAEQREKERKERNKQFAIDNAEETFTFINDLTTLFEGQSEESQKRAFKIRKAAAIAQTAVETFKSAQGAYASQLIPGDPTSPIRGAIAAAFAVAGGLARIKSIASQKFEGGGASSASAGGGGSTGGGATPAEASVPAQFNVVGNSGTNQIVEGLNNKPVKAYVVSGEMSTAQSLERNKIGIASL